MNPPGPLSNFRKLLIPLALLIFPAFNAQAQTDPVASKQMDISIFSGYQNVAPDYGFVRNNGFMIGADITRYIQRRIDPSLEFRVNYTPNTFVSEKSFEVGIRAQGDYGRFHPYVDLLGGVATLNFPKGAPGKPTYSSNSGGTFSVGGGVDFDIYRRLQAKVDYQQQFMYFDQNITLTPRPVTVGIAYRIPFRPHISSK